MIRCPTCGLRLVDAEPVVQSQFAGDVADALPQRRARGARLRAEHPDDANVGTGKVEQDADRRGLSRAVRAEVADDESFGHREVEAVERGNRAEAFAHALTTDDLADAATVVRRG